jgi:tetratricopeptide (TPR) repeat protein
LALASYPEDKSVVAAIQGGDRAASEERYIEALGAYTLAAQRCPGCPQPHRRLGAVYVLQGRYDEAQAAYLNAVRLGGLGDATMEGLAALHAAQQNERLAIAELESLLSRHPGRGDLWVQLGDAYRAAGDSMQARRAFERALALDIPAGPRQRVHELLGVLCLGKGSGDLDAQCALEHLEAASRGPDQALAESAARLGRALGQLLAGTGQADPALARAMLGEALYLHGELELARGQFEEALALRPAYADAHTYLGHVLSQLGEAEAAVEHLERAIALAPTNTLPRYFLGMHYLGRGWWVTGREVLEEAHDLDPDDPALCAAIADAHVRGGTPSYRVAERWFKAAVDRAPGDPRFHLLLAQFYTERALDPGVRGVAAAQVAVRLAPESYEAQETLGWAYHLDGRPDQALEPLSRALELASEGASGQATRARLYYRLGEAYRALSQAGQARQHLEMAAGLDWNGPTGERARQALERGLATIVED